jgi:sugar phosphate isomerase/epimerase
VPLGQGTADYPGIVAGLEHRSFGGFFVVGEEDASPDSPQRAAEAIEYLTNL